MFRAQRAEQMLFIQEAEVYWAWFTKHCWELYLSTETAIAPPTANDEPYILVAASKPIIYVSLYNYISFWTPQSSTIITEKLKFWKKSLIKLMSHVMKSQIDEPLYK